MVCRTGSSLPEYDKQALSFFQDSIPETAEILVIAPFDNPIVAKRYKSLPCSHLETVKGTTAKFIVAQTR